VGSWVCIALCVLSLCASCSEAALGLGRHAAVELLHIDSPSDFGLMTTFIFIAYACQYLGMSGAFELTNPRGFRSKLISTARAEKRRKQVAVETRLGLRSMAFTVGFTMLWMCYGEPRTLFYGYFENHEYNWMWFVGGLIAYMIGFDTWFYWSHRWLHDIDFLWNNVHYVHHQFKEPSAFAQFAVHPLEAIMQGPVGHYMGSLFFPIHPVQLAVLGFLGSSWAIAAHDGRQFDFNSHYNHHCKGRGRFIYFNLGYLTPFWDRWCNTRWTEDHPKWIQWKEKRGKEVFDTQDGKASSVSNDVYGAYADVTGATDFHANATDGEVFNERMRGPQAKAQ